MKPHTPTPWHSEEVRTAAGRCFKIGSPEMTNTNGKPSYVCVYDDWGHGENVQSANAAFIVKAVNSHDALVKALLKTQGRIMNAKIDLQTGHTKAAGIRTLEGIIKFVDDALASIEEFTP